MVEETCLGTETLAAFVDASADAESRAHVIAHASRCSSCREILSALARDRTKPERPSQLGGAESFDIGQLVGRYVITGTLGMGGMGAVYSARDPELDRNVAIKLLLPGDTDLELQERLRREAQAMAQLAHPNVVTVHDVGVVEGRIFVAMELVEGSTLATWLEQPRPVAEILDAFVAAGRGLAAAHAAGLVHRDFKPENVFVGADGRVRVGDFGLVRDLAVPSLAPHVREQRVDLTSTGVVMGTPLYMSPEQHRGDAADARSDQFSFSVALFWALEKHHPFEGKTVEALALAVERGVPQPALVGARHVRKAIMRGLSRDPASRWPTLDAMLGELTPRPRRWPWLLAFAGVLLVATIVTAVVFDSNAATPQRLSVTGCELDAIGNGWTPFRDELRHTLGAPVVAAADAYAASWHAIHRTACRARYGAPTSNAVPPLGSDRDYARSYPLVLNCLNLRKTEFFELRDLLRHIDPDSAPQRASDALAELRSVDDCRDLATLRRAIRPVHPTAQNTAILRTLARIRALRAVGHVDDAAQAFARLEISAIEPSTRAEVLDVGGLVATSARDFDLAMARFTEAADLAERGHDDAVRAEALVEATTVSRLRGHEDPALRAKATAAAAVLATHERLERRLSAK